MSSEPYYFPYLRARGTELLAVSSELSELVNHGRVIPIFEPVKQKLTRLERMLTKFRTGGLNSIVIENPTVGELVGQAPTIRPLVAATQSVPGFIVSNNTTQAELSRFLQAYPNASIAIVHRSSHLTAKVVNGLVAPITASACHIFECDDVTYVNGVRGSFHVRLRDVFEAQAKNADYPPRSDFGDLPFTHTSQGFQGFGDYLTVGRKYVPGGGPAWAVAIHVTRNTGASKLECRHFVSSSNSTQANPNGKQLEAIDDLFAAIQGQPNLFIASRGIGEFRAIHQSRHATSLGGLKRISIRHHLELMMATI